MTITEHSPESTEHSPESLDLEPSDSTRERPGTSAADRSLKNLELGRGTRPKLDRETVAMRLDPETRAGLEAIAASYGCTYGGKPWIAGLLERIGTGQLIVVPAPPSLDEQSASKFIDPKAAKRDRLRRKMRECSSPDSVEICDETDSNCTKFSSAR